MAAADIVVVVGAGAAGLTCATDLNDAGFRVVVLEARNRIGGRIHTLTGRGEVPVELGAQVIHGDVDAAELGLLDDAVMSDVPRWDSVKVVFGGRARGHAQLLSENCAPPWV